jgi:hypothetical protein
LGAAVILGSNDNEDLTLVRGGNPVINHNGVECTIDGAGAKGLVIQNGGDRVDLAGGIRVTRNGQTRIDVDGTGVILVPGPLPSEMAFIGQNEKTAIQYADDIDAIGPNAQIPNAYWANRKITNAVAAIDKEVSGKATIGGDGIGVEVAVGTTDAQPASMIYAGTPFLRHDGVECTLSNAGAKGLVMTNGTVTSLFGGDQGIHSVAGNNRVTYNPDGPKLGPGPDPAEGFVRLLDNEKSTIQYAADIETQAGLADDVVPNVRWCRDRQEEIVTESLQVTATAMAQLFDDAVPPGRFTLRDAGGNPITDYSLATQIIMSPENVHGAVAIAHIFSLLSVRNTIVVTRNLGPGAGDPVRAVYDIVTPGTDIGIGISATIAYDASRSDAGGGEPLLDEVWVIDNAPITILNTVHDVAIAGQTAGDYLHWSGSVGKWVNVKPLYASCMMNQAAGQVTFVAQSTPAPVIPVLPSATVFIPITSPVGAWGLSADGSGLVAVGVGVGIIWDVEISYSVTGNIDGDDREWQTQMLINGSPKLESKASSLGGKKDRFGTVSQTFLAEGITEGTTFSLSVQNNTNVDLFELRGYRMSVRGLRRVV